MAVGFVDLVKGKFVEDELKARWFGPGVREAHERAANARRQMRHLRRMQRWGVLVGCELGNSGDIEKDVQVARDWIENRLAEANRLKAEDQRATENEAS
eukprot:6368849-Alexandrium_andersonii.AAC.1